MERGHWIWKQTKQRECPHSGANVPWLRGDEGDKWRAKVLDRKWTRGEEMKGSDWIWYPLNEWISLFHLYQNNCTTGWRLLNRKTRILEKCVRWTSWLSLPLLHIVRKTCTSEGEAVVVSFSIILEEFKESDQSDAGDRLGDQVGQRQNAKSAPCRGPSVTHRLVWPHQAGLDA